MNLSMIVHKYLRKIPIISKVVGEETSGVIVHRLFVLALFRRASCRIAKLHYTDAKADLDRLLSIDPENNDAKVNLLSYRGNHPGKSISRIC